MEQTNIIPMQRQFNTEQIDILRRTVAKDVPPAEFAVFLEVCKYRQLNPFNREIYAIMRQGQLTIQVSIDGFRLLAERSGKYRGQKGPFFCGPDGEWKEMWLSDEPPTCAKVGIIRADFDDITWVTARYSSYVQLKDGKPNTMWKKFADVLLAKCAEALAFRKCFPALMAGIYTHEEMMQADTEETRVKVPTMKALYEKCQQADICEQDDSEAFYALCTVVLNRTITRENARTVKPEERVQIDEEINKLRTVESEQLDGYQSLEEMNAELSSQQA
jgi:phage recombination protein Bet